MTTERIIHNMHRPTTAEARAEARLEAKRLLSEKFGKPISDRDLADMENQLDAPDPREEIDMRD